MENESKHERFVRIASARTEKVIQRIEQLANCANRANYEYSAAEAEKIFTAIDEVLNACRAAYREQEKRKRAAFTLSAEQLPGRMSIADERSEFPSAEELHGEEYWGNAGKKNGYGIKP